MVDVIKRGRRLERRPLAGTPHPAGDRPQSARYRHLVNPLVRQGAYSADEVNSIHEAALRVIEQLGIKVLNPEARSIFKAAGATVDEATWNVKIDRALITGALATSPREFDLKGARQERDVRLGGGHVAFMPVGGSPNITDLDRGKRPSTLADTRNIIKLSQHFDVMHVQSPNVEAQDIPLNIRHYQLMESQLTLSDKPPGIYSRGKPQVLDSLETVRLARGLTQAEFEAAAWCYTVINSNSPRQLDIPMCQGIIDVARAGQVVVMTPFTLAGAMAPITISGALTLQHAEALAGIALAQFTRVGAPVVYGSFTSNVDMKSGAPAFGTPEFVRGAFGAGQLARHIGLPWRGSAATASNIADAQSAYEFLMSAWGSILGGVNLMIHAAGWLEGGLTGSYEKYILDIEMLQIFAEVFLAREEFDADTLVAIIAEVEPGGHFFGSPATMSRYLTAFYEPIVSDWRNFGQWSEAGAKSATERANGIWKKTLAEFEPPPMDPSLREALDDFIARRTHAGGAFPES